MSIETELTESQIEVRCYETNSDLARDYGIPTLAVIIPALNEAVVIFKTIIELKEELQEFGGKSTCLAGLTENLEKIAFRANSALSVSRSAFILEKGEPRFEAIGAVLWRGWGSWWFFSLF